MLFTFPSFKVAIITVTFVVLSHSYSYADVCNQSDDIIKITQQHLLAGKVNAAIKTSSELRLQCLHMLKVQRLTKRLNKIAKAYNIILKKPTFSYDTNALAQITFNCDALFDKPNYMVLIGMQN